MDKIKTNIKLSFFSSIKNLLFILIYFKARKRIIFLISKSSYSLVSENIGFKFRNISESIKNDSKLNFFVPSIAVLYSNNPFLFNSINKKA